MVHFSVMYKLTAYCLATVALTATSACLAGPTTPDMASADASFAASTAAEVASVEPTFESLAPPPALLADDLVSDPFAASGTGHFPNGPHPMIPLPPAVWAGFAGLAFVARRVLRGRPG